MKSTFGRGRAFQRADDGGDRERPTPAGPKGWPRNETQKNTGEFLARQDTFCHGYPVRSIPRLWLQRRRPCFDEQEAVRSLVKV